MDYRRQRERALRALSDGLERLPAGVTEVDNLIDSAVRQAWKMPPGKLYGFLPAEKPKNGVSAPIDASTVSPEAGGDRLAQKIIAYMAEKGYAYESSPAKINIVYVEGMNLNGTLNDDKPNVFNDARLVIQFKDGSPRIVGKWLATTEPGVFYTDNPMNIRGAARIKFGQYRAWRVGTHGVSNPHEALVQVAPVTVHRDYNRDMARTGDKEDTGLFGINQHSAYGEAISNIGKSSAGCLVGHSPAGHREFMQMIKTDVNYRQDPNYMFATTIIPGNDLLKKSDGGGAVAVPSPPPRKDLISTSQATNIFNRQPTEQQMRELNECMARFEINTPQRIRHWLAQIAHESGGLRWMEEIASGTAYEGRADLGNTEPGDGPRFKGVGAIQVTGRYNYQKFADYIGDQRVMEGIEYVRTKYAFLISGHWWHRNKMNALCDTGATVKAVTKVVNPGLRGLEERIRYYEIARKIIK